MQSLSSPELRLLRRLLRQRVNHNHLLRNGLDLHWHGNAREDFMTSRPAHRVQEARAEPILVALKIGKHALALGVAQQEEEKLLAQNHIV